MNKEIYIIFGGDCVDPYEPPYPIASFLDKDKAEEFLKKFKEEDEKNCQLNEQNSELYKQYFEYLENENIKYDYDGIADEKLSKKFGVTKEFAHDVMNYNYYYPQVYYISSVELYE